MRKIILLPLIILLTLLSSCADASVYCGISETNTVTIEYSLTLSTGGEDLSSYVNQIISYWENSGFTTDLGESDNVYKLCGTKTIECSSAVDAADEFAVELTDSNSLFYNVELNYNPSYFEDNYSLTASVSLKGIIRQSEVQDIPQDMAESILSNAETGEYILKLSMPGEITATNADSVTEGLCTWVLEFGEERLIELTTKNVFEDKVAYYNGLNETKDRDYMIFIICSGSAGLFLVLFIITVIVKKSKRSRKSKVYSHRF